jgi:hypothetical protein
MAVSRKMLIGASGATMFCVGAWFLVNYEGQNRIWAIAKERDFCKTETCEEGITLVYDGISAKYSVSRPKIDWCIGVQEVNKVEVRKGSWLKNMIVEAAYWPCSEFRARDS